MAVDNRRFIVTLDNTIGRGRTSGNVKIMNNILKVLKNGGLNAEDGGIGPSMWTNAVRNNCRKSNTVILGFCNGSDAGVVEEATNNYGYNRDNAGIQSAINYKNRKGEIFRGGKDHSFHGTGGFLHNVDKYGNGTDRHNDLVLCFFYNAADFYNPGGEYYEFLVRAHDDNYSRKSGWKGISYPRKWLEDYDIGIVYNKGDYDGTSTAKKVLALFDGSGDSSTDGEDSTLTASDTLTTADGKTVSNITTETVVTKPYYQKVFTTKTNADGTYSVPLELEISGLYNVNHNFSGDKNYLGCTKTTKIENYSGRIFTQEELEKRVTTNYSDGSNEVNVSGSVNGQEHTQTITTVQTYKDNAVSEETTTTVDNDKINTDFKTDTTTTTTPTTTTTTTPVNTNKKDPFQVVIPLVNNKPDVNSMQTGTKTFANVDLTKTYTLSKDHYTEVFNRDSKSLQVNNYYDSSYTAFLSKETPNEYQVIERERWNAVEESIYYSLVKNTGREGVLTSPAWPDEIKIDFSNKRTYLLGDWTNWKAEKCKNHFVGDDQNLGYTCGPTSCSVVTQVLHNYHSERYMQNLIGASPGVGSAPSTHKNKMEKIGFGAKLYYKISDAVSHLKERKPCTWHCYDHYIALCRINDKGQILVANSVPTVGSSSNSYKYRPFTGWHTQSEVSSRSFGSAILVWLEWTISQEEKTKLTKFFSSMGGKYDVSNNTESIRWYDI